MFNLETLTLSLFMDIGYGMQPLYLSSLNPHKNSIVDNKTTTWSHLLNRGKPNIIGSQTFLQYEWTQ